MTCQSSYNINFKFVFLREACNMNLYASSLGYLDSVIFNNLYAILAVHFFGTFRSILFPILFRSDLSFFYFGPTFRSERN